MRVSIIKMLKEYLKDKPATKLIDIVNDLHKLGLPVKPNSYMAVYITLRENEAFFEKVSKGFYKVRNNKDCQDLLKSKLDGEEVKEFILRLLKNNSSKTPAQIWRVLRKNGNYVPYKTVHRILQTVDFTKKQSTVLEKSYKSNYSLTK